MFYGFVRLYELLFVPLKTLDLDQTLDETKEKTQKLQYSTEKNPRTPWSKIKSSLVRVRKKSKIKSSKVRVHWKSQSSLVLEFEFTWKN